MQEIDITINDTTLTTYIEGTTYKESVKLDKNYPKVSSNIIRDQLNIATWYVLSDKLQNSEQIHYRSLGFN